MTAHFESVQNAAMYPDAFDVAAPEITFERNLWPRKLGLFVRNASAAEGAATDAALAIGLDAELDAGLEAKALTAPVRELAVGQFGFVPRWVKSASDAKLRATKMVNARSETVTTSNNFRDAWLAGQRCIVPMTAFFEDDWHSGKALPTRITRVDGKPMGVAGIWERWAKDGTEIISFTLLTVNANSHALLHRYQQSGNEKRMPVILGEGAYGAWLHTKPEKAREFMRAYSAQLLTANPVERK
ncbi:SOS response-associated peptidase family protein [Limnohabitans sp.]|uniref:SOS response-associated peptidase n=1 Tax=Limnohabitans sp. TaxID=1907725 RepID=UPI00286EBC35|nr:SOS response-associated peptidase family protein [Limnohabitans sp.]